MQILVAGGTGAIGRPLVARLVADWHTPALESVVLRYGFLYGPGTWYEEHASVAGQVRTQAFPIIGSGSGVWSFVHVEDAAAATAAAITDGAPGIYHVTDDEPLPLATWLPAYARWLDAPCPPRLPTGAVDDADAPFHALRLRGASNARARRELGFRPRSLPWLATL